MKLRRHSKIIELINAQNVETQEELAEGLKNAGFSVTQATVSRDIKELGIIKIQTAGGGQKYAVLSSMENQVNDRLIRIFCDGVVSIDYAQNMIVIKTLEGMAEAVAAALDSMNMKEIIGTIAGDNTIFCVAKSEQKALQLIGKMNGITEKRG